MSFDPTKCKNTKIRQTTLEHKRQVNGEVFGREATLQTSNQNSIKWKSGAFFATTEVLLDLKNILFWHQLPRVPSECLYTHNGTVKSH